MDPELRIIEPSVVLGLAIRTSNAEEMDSATAKIAGHWQRFFAEGWADKLTVETSPQPLGVYCEFESDANGPYTLVVGYEIGAETTIPDTLQRVDLAAGNYLVFDVTGPMPQAVIAGWQAIWQFFETNEQNTRAYTTDFERYREAEEGQVSAEIFASVE